ncbi:MAG TPA: hypothetical protein VGM03_22230 [Phycisphaerae bacterium]|jgi:predicted metal-dependent hydrolase
MTTTEFRELLSRDPFEPFRIRVTSGEHYAIRDPMSTAVLAKRLFVALPDGERWVLIPYRQISAIEALRGEDGVQPGKTPPLTP